MLSHLFSLQDTDVICYIENNSDHAVLQSLLRSVSLFWCFPLLSWLQREEESIRTTQNNKQVLLAFARHAEIPLLDEGSSIVNLHASTKVVLQNLIKTQGKL